MTTNNAQSEAKRENTLIENVKVLALYKKDLRNYLMWKGDSGLVATIEKMEKQAALLDAPETVEGLDEALTFFEPDRVEIAHLISKMAGYDKLEKVLEAARLYAQSRQSAGVPDGCIVVKESDHYMKLPSSSTQPSVMTYKNVYTALKQKAAPQPPAGGVDVEALKREMAEHFGRTPLPDEIMDYLHQRGLLCLSKSAENEKQTDLSITDGKQSGLIGQDLAAVREVLNEARLQLGWLFLHKQTALNNLADEKEIPVTLNPDYVIKSLEVYDQIQQQIALINKRGCDGYGN